MKSTNLAIAFWLIGLGTRKDKIKNIELRKEKCYKNQQLLLKSNAKNKDKIAENTILYTRLKQNFTVTCSGQKKTLFRKRNTKTKTKLKIVFVVPSTFSHFC